MFIKLKSKMDLFGLASIPNNLHKELIMDEKNNYWIKMPEMITTFAVAVSYTQKDLEHYLDQED